MRVLAVDFGRKRIGLAVGESEHRVVRALQNLPASGTLSIDAQAIKRAAGSESAGTVVMGLPLDAGGETKASQICRKLGGLLAELGVSVKYVDESLTSQDAEQSMIDAGLKGSERRKRSDGEAACRILERYFEEKD